MLRLALIGSPATRERYQPIVSRTRRVCVTALAGSDLTGSENVPSTANGEFCTCSLDELLSAHSETFDAVVLPAASEVSERALLQAANAGKHILCVNAVAPSIADVKRITDACRDAGVRFLPALRGRFHPAVRTIKGSLGAGRLGAPGLLRIHQWKPRTTEISPKSVTRGTTGSHRLLEQLIDEIDWACWIFGRPPLVVYARETGPVDGERTASKRAGGYVQLHLGFSEGGMALIDLTAALPPGDSYFSLSLIGSTGASYADDHHNKQLLFGGGAPASLSAGAAETEASAQLCEFVSAIAENREPSPSGKELLAALEVVQAAERALSTGDAAQMMGDA